ncbi:hypothetical protein [Idiomarina sp. HP20-50]|uniref:hypothetical protein n=1 Tax=Idiomarina sp. HP20-50 TaxID=3070813 RepID=UPI00294B82E8|nr:hypothetical protein [Idiomarina sp. HP20-50]MDV6316623.1 hypothetical protein [Idiomarina sp. HP20-50]
MKSKLSLFLIFFSLITGCAPTPIPGHTHGVNFSENDISIVSSYYGEENYEPLKSIAQYETFNLVNIHDEEFTMSIFTTKHLAQCFETERSLEKKVRGLISDEFLMLLEDNNLGVYFIPKSNFLITSKKKKNSSERLNFVFGVEDTKGCDQKLIVKSFKDAIRTIIHESFHVFIYENKIAITELEDEVLAYTVDYCNEIYASNTKKFVLNNKAPPEPTNWADYSLSLKAYYLFQKGLQQAYSNSYELSSISEKQKAMRFVQEVCSGATHIVSD